MLCYDCVFTKKFYGFLRFVEIRNVSMAAILKPDVLILKTVCTCILYTNSVELV